MRRSIVLALLLTSACATPEVRAQRWLDPLHVERSDGKEGTPAVVLEKSDRVVIYPAGGRFEYTEHHHHEVIQVLTEGGVDLADQKVFFADKAVVTEIRGAPSIPMAPRTTSTPRTCSSAPPSSSRTTRST
jgi:hypothetical protein